jgi:GTP-binding protein HflX
MISDHMTRGAKVYTFSIPVEDGASLAWLHEHGEVQRSETGDDMTKVEVRLSDASFARFTKSDFA